jgi:hypothetical protein
MNKSTTEIAEEQRYARLEILTCAEQLLGGEANGGAALFAGAVQEYLNAELELEAMTADETKRAKLLLVDVVEKEFAKCPHPYANHPSLDWCLDCGAKLASDGRTWLRPHWREIILRALLAGIFALALFACGGSPIDVGSLGPDARASVSETAAAVVDAGSSSSSSSDVWNDSKDELELAADVVELDAKADVVDAGPQRCTELPPDQGATTYVCGHDKYMCGHSCCTLPMCP